MVEMSKIMFVVVSMLLGAVLGSFSCCQAWRIRYREKEKRELGKRSVCLSCGKQLKWFENIPIVSWVMQRGKCRKCGAKIGVAEILSELVGAVMFGLLGWKVVSEGWILGRSGSYSVIGIVMFVFLVAFFTIALILAIYDARWRELPTGLLISLIVLGGAIWGIRLFEIVVSSGFTKEVGNIVINLLGAVGILAGVYYLLYFFSKEKLVGGGDWMLGLGIAFALGDWWLAVWTLFLANFVGALVMIPMKKKKIAFGPFLVGAFVVVLSFSEVILSLR